MNKYFVISSIIFMIDIKEAYAMQTHDSKASYKRRKGECDLVGNRAHLSFVMLNNFRICWHESIK